jgi:broad specificity phosphatase PhoE
MTSPPEQAGATRLVLVRHAETEESARGRCYGRLDVTLSPEGRAHAAALAEALGDLPLTALYTSPLARALDTARPIARVHGVEPLIHPGLAELDFGDLEGAPYDRIAAEQPDLYRRWMESPARVRFPDGESLAELRERALAAVAEIRARHAGGTVAIVSHGGVLRVVLAGALGLGDGELFRIDQPYGAVSLVDWVEGVALVRAINVFLYSGRWRP